MAYKETFISPFLKDTPDEALKVLDEIRSVHSVGAGWIELDAYFVLKQGKYQVVRVHEKLS